MNVLHNYILRVLALIAATTLVACEDGSYVGDGRIEELIAPVLGRDGYLITFPEMEIENGKSWEYTVKQFPKKGRYTLYLRLPNEERYTSLRQGLPNEEI